MKTKALLRSFAVFALAYTTTACAAQLEQADLPCEACDEEQEEPTVKTALIIVDMQYDFLPGGALGVTGGDEIVELINSMQPEFDLVVATQDWHPADHGSFASQHPEHDPGEVIDLFGLDQVLWPDHAVQGSDGAKLVKGIELEDSVRVFQKGINVEVDSYSGFFDNGHRGDTGLNDYLVSEDVTHVFVVGLALDYCVKFTALDAKGVGFNTTLITDATRAVNLQPTDGDLAITAMMTAGVHITSTESL